VHGTRCCGTGAAWEKSIFVAGSRDASKCTGINFCIFHNLNQNLGVGVASLELEPEPEPHHFDESNTGTGRTTKLY
jgi:hypothetical protein